MEILAGLIASISIIGLGYATRQNRSLPFYSTVLIVIALAYVLFTVMADAFQTILTESAVAAVFIVVAVVGSRWSDPLVAGLVVAGGLAVHGAYDLVHAVLVPNPVVPSWWPLFCGAVDILLAGWVARLGVKGDLHA